LTAFNWKRALGLGASLLCAMFASPAIAQTSSQAQPQPQAQATPDAAGLYMARAADCVACHSTPDSRPFAGGLKMGTPMGDIFTTNITPDKQTGIGAYTLADFDRAVRKGIARDGHRLYPAMPYPSYAKLSDRDLAALYDYFMHQVAPVHQQNRPSEIKWPLNMRWPLAIWDALFLDTQPFVPNPSQDVAWNRGAYLVEGAGHCGACHTPRGIAFQEKALDSSDSQFVSGAVLDNWTAVSLRGESSLGLGRWSQADIVAFLRNGSNAHAAVFGPMIDAYNNSTQYMSDADLQAVAVFLKSLAPAAKGDVPYRYTNASAQALLQYHDIGAGAQAYRAQCMGCHGADGAGIGALFPPLGGNANLLAADPSSVINLILNGAIPLVQQGTPAPYRMAPYRLVFDDRQVADIATFIRQSWGNQAGPVSADQVAKIRARTDMSSDLVVVLRMK
jgi:mono/diheme cytochrome c family protein